VLPLTFLQVFDEYDEDVQEAEAEEAAPRRAEKESELKPVHHRGHREHSDAFTPDSGEGDDDDDDDDVSLGGRLG
jgi:hypothetical protein